MTGPTGGNELVFELTPRNEGFFFCQNGDEASNVAEVVAFPLQDPVVRAIPRYSVPIGSDVVLECVYNEIGALSSRYRVEWYRGLVPLLNLETALPERYTLGSNNSLVIDDTTVSCTPVPPSQRVAMTPTVPTQKETPINYRENSLNQHRRTHYLTLPLPPLSLIAVRTPLPHPPPLSSCKNVAPPTDSKIANIEKVVPPTNSKIANIESVAPPTNKNIALPT